jgi:hypothetical protein
MADITITKANVAPGTNATFVTGTAGGTVTTGQPVYLDSTDGNKVKAADADAEASASCVGIAVCDALDEQPVVYQTAGNLGFGAILTKGSAYYVTTTAGGIGLFAEIASGDYVSQLGIASSTSNLVVKLNVTGITI